MKRKTLLILLIIPLVIGLISFVSVTILVNTVPIDIDGISWQYDSQVGFKVSDTPYKLEAEAIILDESKIIDEGNNLVWSVSQEEECVSISKSGDTYYLTALKEGRSTITCSNEKKTVGKSFTAIVYENSAILINTNFPKASSSSIANSAFFNDDNYVYGEYDYTNSLVSASKTRSSLSLKVEILGEVSGESVAIKETSDNLLQNGNKLSFSFIGSGEAYIDFAISYLSERYTFKIIEGGVNIYSYDDLLRATNKSEAGEIIVLRTNLLSLDSLYTYEEVDVGSKTNAKIYKDSANTNVNSEIDKLFGHFDFALQSFSFEEEIYKYDSAYLTEYIDQLNQSETYLKQHETISKERLVGIHIKKDFYGNGYTISAHNLTFPRYAKMYDNYGKDGRLKPLDTSSNTIKPYPYTGKDLFTGPNYFLSIGDFHENNFIAAYGEDNSAFLIDKDNVTVRDVAIYGCDQVDNLYDYTYVGNTINILSNNVSLKNALVANGKNVIRAFSSDNLNIDNCVLSRSAEFLLLVGSNEYQKVDDNKEVSFNYGANQISGTLKELSEDAIDKYLSKYLGLDGDTVSSIFGTSSIKNVEGLSNSQYVSFLRELQSNGYDAQYEENQKIDAEIHVNNTYFEDSGMFSIALETNFAGPYLYNGGPTPISSYFGSSLKVKAPKNISGTSKGVKLVLEGDTSFYDYKDIDSIDMNTLIEDNLSSFVSNFLGSSDSSSVTIDNFFPVKPLLKDTCLDSIYQVSVAKEGSEEIETLNYLNTKVIYYGGGINNSLVSDLTTHSNLSSREIELDLVKAFTNKTYSNISSDATINGLVSTLAKCVLMVTGSHNFKTIVNSSVSNNTKPIDFDSHYDINKIRSNYVK